MVVHSQDLSLKGRLEKIGHLRPRRDLRRDAPAVRFLESVSRAYREPAAPFTPTGRRPKGSGFLWLAGRYEGPFNARRGLRYVFAGAPPGGAAKIYPNQDRSPHAGGVK
ncbi:MAG: hypothetical protein M1598_09845 [Actinobacteria bacterium]|nr:hypothetical protein [Actinomycetota bacterium]